MQLRILFIAILLTLPGMAALPVKATITDTKGRVIEGTILAKSDKAITFQPKGNTKTFEIQLETLSPDTQTFVRDINKAGLQTIIDPGNQTILAIPFEAQKRAGICAAASTINILKFHKPTLKIDQEKLFSLFDAGPAGATPQQVIAGIASLGFTGILVPVQLADREQLLADIKANLDAGRPVIAASKTHATVLFGYNSSIKPEIFYLWDQRGPHNKRPSNGLPAGTEEIPQSRFMTATRSVMFITPSK